MAVTHAITEVWAARLLNALARQSVWHNFVNDQSSEVSSEGDKLHLNKITSAVTVKNYTKNTDIDDPETITDEDNILNLNQQKYFHIEVDDIDEVQTKPSLLDAFAGDAARAVSLVLNDYLRGQYDGARVATGTGQNLVTSQRAANDATLDATPAFAEKIIEHIFDVSKKLDDAFWPAEGRWMIYGSLVQQQINWYLLQKGTLFSGQLQDSVFMNGFLKDFFGFRVGVDQGIPQSLTGNNYVKNNRIYFGLPETLVYASQISKVEAYRPEKRFADRIKGLYTYGALVPDKAKAYFIDFTSP